MRQCAYRGRQRACGLAGQPQGRLTAPPPAVRQGRILDPAQRGGDPVPQVVSPVQTLLRRDKRAFGPYRHQMPSRCLAVVDARECHLPGVTSYWVINITTHNR